MQRCDARTLGRLHVLLGLVEYHGEPPRKAAFASSAKCVDDIVPSSVSSPSTVAMGIPSVPSPSTIVMGSSGETARLFERFATFADDVPATPKVKDKMDGVSLSAISPEKLESLCHTFAPSSADMYVPLAEADAEAG